LLQPESKVPKTYYGKVAGVVSPDEYFRLAFGIDIGRGETTAPAIVREVRATEKFGIDIGRGETTAPAIVREVRATEKYTWFELTITEGKNRQVRRMFEAIDHAMLKLVRVRIGPLELGDLPPGKFKVLSRREALSALLIR
jgi:23S rRNA pseudouridine2605 synthase